MSLIQNCKDFLGSGRFFSTTVLVGCLCATTASVSLSTFADSERTSEPNADNSQMQFKEKRGPNWQRLAQRLNLNEEQKPAFIAMLSEYHERRKALRQASGLKQAMEEIDLQVEQDLASILNPEQLEQFVSHRNERKLRHHHRPH